MSRFGLRSSSDVFKASDKESKQRNLGTDRMLLKRNLQKKKKVSCTDKELLHPSEDNMSPVSIVCSLPLNRLSGFIEKFHKCNKKSSCNNKERVEGINVSDNKTKRDTNDSFHSNIQDFNECTSILKERVKFLCLYCDKKFTSSEIQLKHVEKFHIYQNNRRCSRRNSQAIKSNIDIKKKRGESCGILIAKYPGCTYCKRSKNHQIEEPFKDLKGLFFHFIDSHSDKYFGCKTCLQRFQNLRDLTQHMKILHKNISLLEDKRSVSDTFEKGETNKVKREKIEMGSFKLKRSVNVIRTPSPEEPKTSKSNTIMVAEEQILSRLGPVQNRLPNSRRVVRLRKESNLTESILKPEKSSLYTSIVKARNKSGKNAVRESGDAEVVFRIPTRIETMSSSFEENFYREVISNVRNNLLYFLDGKIFENVSSVINSSFADVRRQQRTNRIVFSESDIALDENNAFDPEIHAATSLATITAFPTLLTAEQYGGDPIISKIRRPHTKHSWKWKWDRVKKYKLISEGGKIIKKVKQPMLGLRDLSKLDMWTQLYMRQKHEMQQNILNTKFRANKSSREDKQRVNEQLNYILDTRLLPHIILEQNDQTVIKIENGEIGILSTQSNEVSGSENNLNETLADNLFFTVLQLLPNRVQPWHCRQLILSGEWARPRCYLCMCCGAKFEKLKCLEEHKMFRHSHVLSTHYEVVGRELLASNSLCHLFIPNRALSFYGNDNYNYNYNVLRKLVGPIGDDDSSDSNPSTLNSCTINTYSVKLSTTTDECDTDTKPMLDINNASPSNSMQSSNTLLATPLKSYLKCIKCSKCARRCSGTLDLYRHMLDCSGDYIWSLAKKRKYRYYCGSKKRRPWNKQNFRELRKKQPKITKPSLPLNDTEESVSSIKIKNTSRQRPSDAESIQKMLENLPPKRICKKIFPALTKTKNSKFVVKHKMFATQGRMGSQRARKITKFSKAGTKFASKASITKKRQQNKTEKILAKKQLHKMSKVGKSFDNDTNKNITSKSTDKQSLTNTTNTMDNSKTWLILGVDKAITKPSQGQTEAESTKNAESTENTILESRSRVCDSLRSNKFAQKPDLQKSGFSENSGVQSNSQFIGNITCNKKRSKKINDCIAMLTGKLEEKLKTEQYTLSKYESCLEAGVTTGNNKQIISKSKLPKRKTISRKIIKIDNVTDQTPTILPVVPPEMNAQFVENQLTQKTSPISDISKTIKPLKTDAQNSVNTNNIKNIVNRNSLQESNLFKKYAKELVAGNLDSDNFVVLPISTIPSNVTPATLLPKKNSTSLVEKIKKPTPILPMSNSIRELVPKFPALSLGLQLQGIKGDTPPIQQPPVLSVLPHSSILPTAWHMTPVVPVAPMTPIVSVAPMTPIVHVEPLFNSEPLNLSSTKNIKTNNLNELNCFPLYRSGIPARRQTICGFEAKSFITGDEPLDLSKKSSKDQASDIPAVMTLMPLIQPIKSQNDHQLGLNLTVSTPQETALNKQFYSNLDLLKIPQIRSSSNVTTTREAGLTGFAINCSSKKRNGSKSKNDITSMQVANKVIGKEISPNRKENTPKGKNSQKMDDEVINHIDDAINSVINAVKASLTDNNEENVDKSKLNVNSINLQQFSEIPPSHNLMKSVNLDRTIQLELADPHIVSNLPLLSLNSSKGHEDVTKNKAENVKLMKFSPQKRSVRSKTLDCRPSVLATTSVSLQQLPNDAMTEDKVVYEKVSEQEVTKRNMNVECSKNIKNIPGELPDISISDCKLRSQNFGTLLENIKTVPCRKSNNDTSVSNEAKMSEKGSHSLQFISHTKDNNCVSPIVEEIIREEYMSTINNTSSGFHSSGQADCAIETKKKQRRRRKNELAAIVADQLLESFKIDQTRRDNLKKLENLAYEKSEDLFVTGMLLMSSTKRSIISSKSDQHDSNLNKNSKDAIRQKHDLPKSKTIKHQLKHNIHTEVVCSNNETSKKIKDADVKRNKRKQNRSKSKPLDNENISQLKSSLESFSIGMENQVTELEAENSVGLTISESKVLNISTESGRPSLLRPSILSVNTESNATDKRTLTAETKGAISSRDPRLNKNIHKYEQDKLFEARTWENYKHLDEIKDIEEDNYLTEIAKNVNEKIMSTDDAEFMFVNGDFDVNEMQDDSISKYHSRPPTSMSIRSAPNLNEDRSNFGSMYDENTNTEVTDMDLEDQLSVYTSYSQDAARVGGRRKRRRRSILMKRKPKKRIKLDSSAEKFECDLCKKSFYSLNSLTKHNMTLAHVSKLSAHEYRLSKALENTPKITDIASTDKEIRIESTLSKTPIVENDIHEASEAKESSMRQTHLSNQEPNEKVSSFIKPTQGDIGKERINTTSPRLHLNPDERLFFECCNILKGTETACINNVEENNVGSVFEDKMQMNVVQGINIKPFAPETPKKLFTTERVCCKSTTPQYERRSPMLDSALINRCGTTKHHPFHPVVSQFSAATNTTSRFKTKAAMKGYENTNVDLTLRKDPEVKTQPVCKLTELAEIALGNEKSNSADFTSVYNQQEGSMFIQITNRKYISTVVAGTQKQCTGGNDGEIKINEALSSTSSKTIMHSSKIKSSMGENSNFGSRKIIIPDRPFKNIGLEEKETITFQKPKTSVNLLTDDNSFSASTYSDRDDFDFASLSCDEELDLKVSNDRNVKKNSESSCSIATAKTFENKSLIMDRIFKNMGSKAKTLVKVQSIGIQKDPSTKTDINKLFDELREKSDNNVKSLEHITTKQYSSVETSANFITKQRQTSSQGRPLSLNLRERETRKNSNNSTKSQREITRLQSELGMSKEEIVKLINEDQRKSKRRCATHRPKKLVEMWSSDEYEEFLSTKDIIALIEEKEKQETRKRRKSENQLSLNNNRSKNIEKPKQIANRRKNVRCSSNKVNKLDFSSETKKKCCSKTNGTEEIQHYTPIYSLESKGKSTRTTLAESDMKICNVNSEINQKNTLNNKKSKQPKHNSSTLDKNDKKVAKVENLKKCKLEKDGRAEKFVSQIKNTNRTTRRNREKKQSECKDSIVSTIKTTNKRACGSVNKKFTKNVKNNNSNNSSSNNKVNNLTYKNRRKNQLNQSSPRRKRLASEKLYYWSSSSDEDFGKINSYKELDGSEQYRKHGWIVGDSHKKLVTLLAIAKGNKKVDNNCGGVKKNIFRKIN